MQISNWLPNTYYEKGTIVYHNNVIYRAINTFTSSSSFNSNNWLSISSVGPTEPQAYGNYDPAGTAASDVATETTRAQTAEALALQKSANLSDLASSSTARTNLGLGSAATHSSTDFDTAGSATAAQSASVPINKSASSILEGVFLIAYGDSYTALKGGPTYATQTWFDRVVGRARGRFAHIQGGTVNSGNADNMAVGGMRVPDMAMYAYGTATQPAGGGASVAGTFGVSAFLGGICFVFIGGNDSGYDGKGGTPTQHQAGFSNSLNALIRLFRASARTEDTAAAFVYTGTWTANTGLSGFSTGTNHASSTPGDHVTVTTPSGTDFDLILGALDTANYNGAAFTMTVDGSPYTPPYGPTTTNNQMQSSGGSQFNLGYCPMAIPLHGLSNQAHTIVLTHAGTSGQYLFVDCLLTQSSTPPTVFVGQIPHKGAAGYNWYNTTGGSSGASTTTDDTYNGLITSLLANLPQDGSIVTWNPNSAGWLPTYGVGGHLSSGDAVGLHPNDAGQAFLADGIMSILNSLSAREGLVTI